MLQPGRFAAREALAKMPGQVPGKVFKTGSVGHERKRVA
jgi:hypothetical protein